jgi:DNA polymerase-3 subunit delta
MNEYNQIISELQSGNYKPFYLIQGDEPYYIDKIADFAEEHLLSEDERAFNLHVLYGDTTNVLHIIDLAKSYPMGSEKTVVIVREGQSMSQLKKVENLDPLLRYLEQPQSTSVVIFCYKYGKVNGNTKFVKSLKKQKAVFEFKKLYDNQVPAWIEGELRNRGFKVSPKAAALIAENVGSDLSRIYSEIEKLAIVVPKGGEISGAVIERNIGISKDYNNFELVKALGKKNHKLVFSILKYQKSNPNKNPTELTIGLIYSFFSKLLLVHAATDKSSSNLARELGVNPYFVDEYLQAARLYPANRLTFAFSFLREGDMKIKGASNPSANKHDILIETLFKIMNL